VRKFGTVADASLRGDAPRYRAALAPVSTIARRQLPEASCFRSDC